MKKIKIYFSLFFIIVSFLLINCTAGIGVVTEKPATVTIDVGGSYYYSYLLLYQTTEVNGNITLGENPIELSDKKTYQLITDNRYAIAYDWYSYYKPTCYTTFTAKDGMNIIAKLVYTSSNNSFRVELNY